MIHEIDANLLEQPLDGIVHQANCFHTMGGGIARFIKEKYPEAFTADLKTRRADISKLGTFSVAVLPSNFHVFNLYGQYNFGMEKRHTNYEAVYKGLYSICAYATSNGLTKLGLPKNMGCRLGGGSWIIVRAIIEEVFGVWQGDLYICNYEG